MSITKAYRVYTVSVEDHDQMEAASAAMWDLAYFDLAHAKRVIEADAHQYRINLIREGNEDLIGVALPEWAETGDRLYSWTLADDIAGRSWYIQGALLS